MQKFFTPVGLQLGCLLFAAFGFCFLSPGSAEGKSFACHGDTSGSGGSWRSTFTAGAMLAQEKNDLSGAKLLLEYEGNTLLKKFDNSRIHAFFNIGLTRSPQQYSLQTASGAAADNYIASKKSIETGLGLYWAREFKPSSRNVLGFGPLLYFSMENLFDAEERVMVGEDQLLVEGRNQYLFGGGLRFLHYRSYRRGNNLNPEILHSVDFLLNRRAPFIIEYPGPEGTPRTVAQGRLTIEARSKLSGPLFIGFIADFPLDFEMEAVKGEPNLRLWFGFSD